MYYPSFQGQSVRFGLRLSLSSQSRVLFGFVIYSIENEMFFFVLYDLYCFSVFFNNRYRNEFIINNNHYPISSLTEDYGNYQNSLFIRFTMWLLYGMVWINCVCMYSRASYRNACFSFLNRLYYTNYHFIVVFLQWFKVAALNVLISFVMKWI